MDKFNHPLGKLFGLFNGCDYYAITLGQTTFYSCDKKFVDIEWAKHEEAHRLQFAQEGTFIFLYRYIWQLLTKGYKNIDYEIEARLEAKRFMEKYK